MIKYFPAITMIELTLVRQPEGRGRGGQRLLVLPGQHSGLWAMMVINTAVVAVNSALQNDC